MNRIASSFSQHQGQFARPTLCSSHIWTSPILLQNQGVMKAKCLGLTFLSFSPLCN